MFSIHNCDSIEWNGIFEATMNMKKIVLHSMRFSIIYMVYTHRLYIIRIASIFLNWTQAPAKVKAFNVKYNNILICGSWIKRELKPLCYLAENQ